MAHFYLNQPFDIWDALDLDYPTHSAYAPQFPHGHGAGKSPACNKNQSTNTQATGRKCPFVAPEATKPKAEASSSKEVPKEKIKNRESHANNSWAKAFENPDLNPILEALTSQLGLSDLINPLSSNPKPNNKEIDFTPRADIFNTPTKFIVHISLPGAQKDDISLDYDVEKSTLNVAGVVHRPGLTEPLANALLVNGRASEVGVFEKSVRLDTATGVRGPVRVYDAKISAKLADGILVVEVPKLGEEKAKKPRRIEVEQVRENDSVEGKGKQVVDSHEDELMNVVDREDEVEVEEKDFSDHGSFRSATVEDPGDEKEYITI